MSTLLSIANGILTWTSRITTLAAFLFFAGKLYLRLSPQPKSALHKTIRAGFVKTVQFLGWVGTE